MTDKDQSEDGKRAVGGLARKLAASKEGTAGTGGSITLKALRRSVARAAEDLCELPMAVIAARQTNRVPEDLSGLLSDKHLLVVLDCPEGRIGAATFDAAAVTALIQQQTMGTVLGMYGDERNYTPTDAAMVAEFLEKMFSKVTALLEEQTDLRIFEGYRFGAQVEDVRTLVLGMEADDYRVINLNVDLATGKMQGEICLVLPEPSVEEYDESNSVSGPRLGSSVGSMRAELSAVLCKKRIPLRQFSGLKAGDLLPLDQAYLYETDLIAINGQHIAKGRLGQINGARAVRLNEQRTRMVPSNEGVFSDGIGQGAAPALEDNTLDLSIAAQGLQEPGDGLGDDFGGMMGNDFGGDLGGGLGGDLGGNLDGGLDAGDMPMGDFAGMGELPELPMNDLGDFNADDAAAEISELAGLNHELPETGT
ncbi:FliM/FliN family flagellar motor C-terminal domain-containing protein [Tritonibacter scottomollicae]|uniref:FliM/FliN family flagellar motor C-terminal domain-containing protein n=1 Tax=Tritonibacter scottomollicae TaxID=483013 RepID=A0ABZ0HLU3_TRISK|nr:FliM/FliN family flagellar motor C-terminal domain-containing protein [Tritonibacter scottomollicae]WOI34502.1 FliM/FliN family flagellar motor C-terminal domain-containing protein [Tritonibacter scottomollicae]